MPSDTMTAEEFLAARETMPERGAWSELVDGRPVHFDAPDVDHGDVLGNLTRLLTPLATVGTPVFRVGLRTAAITVRFPAVSYFNRAGRFDLIDADAVDEPPAWVVEIASTGDRVRSVEDRVREYLALGVALVWVVSPAAQTIHVVGQDGPPVVTADQTVSAAPIADVQTTPAALCVAPGWYA